jgi:imidazolonepropionase
MTERDLPPGNLIVVHAAQLVTCSGFAAKCGRAMSDLHIIPDGAVAIEDGRIRQVGPSEEVLRHCGTDGYRIIDAAGRAVLPGFVDSHTHLVFGGTREEEFAWRLAGQSYLEIMRRGGGIRRTVQATRRASLEALVAEGMRRLDRMLAFGVTTVEGKSGYGLDHDTELRQLRAMQQLNRMHAVEVVPTFLGAHAVPPEYEGRAEDYIDFVVETVLPEVAREKLAAFCDVFCEAEVFSVAQSRRLLETARARGLGLKIHADEIAPLGGAELAADLHAVSADHLLQASNTGIDRLIEAGVVATLLPATAFSLKEPYARGREMIDRGAAVALATDFNPGSCFSESIPLVAALACLHVGLTPAETVTALTINGAAALGRADRVGSIDPGKQGDLVILDAPSYLFIPYRLGINLVGTVVKAGRVVYASPDRPLINGA